MTNPKALAAKLRAIVKDATGWGVEELIAKNYYSQWQEVGKVAIALEASDEEAEVLKGLKTTIESVMKDEKVWRQGIIDDADEMNSDKREADIALSQDTSFVKSDTKIETYVWFLKLITEEERKA